jgi:polyisoprenoid-binding protein YceI
MMKKYVTGLAIALVASTGALQAQSVRLAVAPDSKLTVEGGSNLHDWHCQATSMDAQIEADEAILKTAPAPSLLKKVSVKVPVRGIKCGSGKMEDNLYKALKANDAPQISYSLGSFEVQPGENDSYTLKTVGSLTIAGTEKTVNMDVTTKRLPDGTLRAQGELPLLLTDFGVKPPTALFGTLRTNNEIKIKFDILVGPQTVSAAAGDRR